MPSTIYKYDHESGNLLSVTASIPWTPEAQTFIDNNTSHHTFEIGIAITGNLEAINWLEQQSKYSWRREATLMNANH